MKFEINEINSSLTFGRCGGIRRNERLVVSA